MAKSSQPKRSELMNDLVNILLFLVALAVIIALLAILDPSVKHFFTRWLP